MRKNGGQTSYRPVRMLSLTDSLPKNRENARKIEKIGFFFENFQKKIFRIGGSNYSILEVIYLIKFSVCSKSIPYWRFIPFGSIPYWSFYCTTYKDLKILVQLLTSYLKKKKRAHKCRNYDVRALPKVTWQHLLRELCGRP